MDYKIHNLTMHAKCVGVLLHIVVVFSNLILNYFVYSFECHTLMSLLNLLKVFKILTNKYHLHQITVFINIFWSCVTSVNFFNKDDNEKYSSTNLFSVTKTILTS